jgi:hypothetical protein
MQVGEKNENVRAISAGWMLVAVLLSSLCGQTGFELESPLEAPK